MIRKTVNIIFKSFFSSLCQCILFGALFTACIFSISYFRLNQASWMFYAFCLALFLFPALSALVFFILRYRKNLGFIKSNLVSKASLFRLSGRISAVLCFLIIGYCISSIRTVAIPDSMTELGVRTIELLHNFFIYIMVSIFPAVFALAEYLFVKSKNNQSYK